LYLCQTVDNFCKNYKVCTFEIFFANDYTKTIEKTATDPDCWTATARVE